MITSSSIQNVSCLLSNLLAQIFDDFILSLVVLFDLLLYVTRQFNLLHFNLHLSLASTNAQNTFIWKLIQKIYLPLNFQVFVKDIPDFGIISD